MYILSLTFISCAFSTHNFADRNPGAELMAYYKDTSAAGWSKRKDCIFLGFEDTSKKTAIVKFPQFSDYASYLGDQLYKIDSSLLFKKWEKGDDIIVVENRTDKMYEAAMRATWGDLEWEMAKFVEAEIGENSKKCRADEYEVIFNSGNESQYRECVEPIFIRDNLSKLKKNQLPVVDIWQKQVNQFIQGTMVGFKDGGYELKTADSNSHSDVWSNPAYVTRHETAAIRLPADEIPQFLLTERSITEKEEDIRRLKQNVEAIENLIQEQKQEQNEPNRKQ